MRLAYFGGSFDPPHCGHLAIARAAAAAFRLDEVLFVPAARQPLKPTGAAASYSDRLAMTALLCADTPGCTASALEAPTPDLAPSYTVDTLRRLHREHPHDDLFVLTGADAFLTLRDWRDPDALLQLAEWIVVSRPGTELNAQLPTLGLTADQRARIHRLEGIAEPASATQIRALLREAHCFPTSAASAQLQQMLTAPVLNYIADHHLYR